jgi:catechol-2,3-dioxygenase
MGDAFTWLRSDDAHHTIAVVRADTPSLDHYSFDVEGWGALKLWCDRLVAENVELCWGPGRHGPGNNVFVMFEDPDGTRIELSAEMEQYRERWSTILPRSWTVEPRTTNLWGPTPRWREQLRKMNKQKQEAKAKYRKKK